MDAGLDTLCIAVYCTADDLLPEPPGNARRMVTDAEVVTLCVAQAIMGIPSDRRFLAVARKRLRHLFPELPAQPGYFKRRRRLADTIEWLTGVFASQSPGFQDDLLLIDSTPVECARSRETVKRSALADAADYGWCASHSRYFWGFRLHAIFAPDGTPRALELTSPKRDEREVGLELLARCHRRGGETSPDTSDTRMVAVPDTIGAGCLELDSRNAGESCDDHRLMVDFVTQLARVGPDGAALAEPVQWKRHLSEHRLEDRPDRREPELAGEELVVLGRCPPFIGPVAASQEATDAVRKQLDFYLVELGEADPWGYARYHCTTVSNANPPLPRRPQAAKRPRYRDRHERGKPFR